VPGLVRSNAVETWTLREVDRKKIEAFVMWIWRRLEKISWRDRINNEDELSRARSETACAGIRNFFGRLEIIPPLLSGRLPYQYAVREREFGQLTVRKIIKIVASRCVS